MKKKVRYDPAIHHRRSIRLKGHDYAGGGIYFVTICAHRDSGRTPFMEPVRGIICEEWERSEKLRSYVHLDEYVVMPDHFHALIRLDAGGAPLGEIIGAFKTAVTRTDTMHGAPQMHGAPTRDVWHRNYYERIVRNKEELKNVRNYIRMNPWKIIVHFDNGMRGIGNPRLWDIEKIGMLCSRNCPAETLEAAELRASHAKPAHCLMSGFHSPPEKTILAALLQSEAKLICCPAWGIDSMKIPSIWLPALEQNRMLILEMKNGNADLAASRERNEFVMQQADKLWIPHTSPNGMLAQLIETMDVHNKRLRD